MAIYRQLTARIGFAHHVRTGMHVDPTPPKATSARETKILDPRDPSTNSGGAELLDPRLVKRGEQWWLYLAGQENGYGATDVYSALLPPGATPSAHGWEITREISARLTPVAARTLSSAWDGKGGRHCPSYVKRFDPQKGVWVERIYYAGAAENLWGPYRIGFLEWEGEKWVDQMQPGFAPGEEWEHGSVYEPNLIYHDGKWKMWYIAGSNHEDYLASPQGFILGFSNAEEIPRAVRKLRDLLHSA